MAYDLDAPHVWHCQADDGLKSSMMRKVTIVFDICLLKEVIINDKR